MNTFLLLLTLSFINDNPYQYLKIEDEKLIFDAVYETDVPDDELGSYLKKNILQRGSTKNFTEVEGEFIFEISNENLDHPKKKKLSVCPYAKNPFSGKCQIMYKSGKYRVIIRDIKVNAPPHVYNHSLTELMVKNGDEFKSFGVETCGLIFDEGLYNAFLFKQETTPENKDW